MPKFWIRYSGIQSCEHNDWEEIETNSVDEAGQIAWELACNDYDSYAGLHGIPSENDVEDELREEYGEDFTDEDVWNTFCDQRESWLSYEVRNIDPTKEN